MIILNQCSFCRTSQICKDWLILFKKIDKSLKRYTSENFAENPNSTGDILSEIKENIYEVYGYGSIDVILLLDNVVKKLNDETEKTDEIENVLASIVDAIESVSKKSQKDVESMIAVANDFIEGKDLN